jgi:MFS family permease
VNRILFFIIIAQFFTTSIWFASNAIIPDLAKDLENSDGLLTKLSIATQLGFIMGTLSFAISAIVDRFSPSKVFFISALLGGICNLTLVVDGQNQVLYILFRFLVGFFLAGVYPVGMKIAADHFSSNLGKSLGFLVAALVLGTAFPHLLKTVQNVFPWEYLIYSTSSLAIIGACIIFLLVPDGQYRKKMQDFQIGAFFHGFKSQQFRESAFGYFGHMWELYTFWTFLPFLIQSYFVYHNYKLDEVSLSILAFGIISIGSIACILAGFLSQSLGAKFTANLFLAISAISCFLFPLFFYFSSSWIYLTFLFVWGFAVIADSPMFSTLVANHSPEDKKGSSITIVNCIGFALTILSIKIFDFVISYWNPVYSVLILGIGPFLGLFYSFQSRFLLLNSINKIPFKK